MLQRLKRFHDWLIHKSPEISQMSLSDALLAKVILSIRQETLGRSFEIVSLHQISLIHPINRQTAIEKSTKRSALLQQHKTHLLSNRHITNAEIEDVMPSVSPIQVIVHNDRYIAFEGNGRLAALQQTFLSDELTIEVEVFSLSRTSSVYKDIERLQKLYSSLSQ